MNPLDPREFADMSREALMAREEEWARRMLGVYRPLREDLLQRIVALKKKLPTLQIESHDAASWQVERLAVLLEQTEAEEARYARKAAATTAGAQQANISAAVNDLGIYTRSLSVPWHTLPTGALEHLVGFMENGQALEQHFRFLGHERYQALRQTLFNGIAQGRSPNRTARDLADTVDAFARKRSTLIVRQESVRAYRESSIGSYRLNSGIVDGWTWLCLLSPNSCAACIALDGTFHPLSEAFGSHTSCRCQAVPHLTIGEMPRLQELGADWFAAQSEDVQRDILGKSKYALYQDGKLSLADVVDRHDSAWGPTASIKSLKQLEAEGIIPPAPR